MKSLPITPYVLVGGRSSRMGRDKAFLPWQGSTLLAHAVRRLSLFGSVRLLSGNAQDAAVQLAPFGMLVPDRTPHSGPLGGIVAALHDTPTDWALILPVDQPCLPTAALLDWVREVVAKNATASWFVPPDGPEPLPLLLHCTLATAITEAFAAGQRRLLPAVGPAAGERGLTFPVAHGEWFRNLNRPEDLEFFTHFDRVD